jgi:hypothetical protein
MQNAGITLPLPLTYIAYASRILLATFKPYTKYSGRSLSLSPTTFSPLPLFRRREGFISFYILLRDLRRYPELI